jgi:hypothetical protein
LTEPTATDTESFQADWLTNLTIRGVAHPLKLWYDSSQNLLGRLPCSMG